MAQELAGPRGGPLVEVDDVRADVARVLQGVGPSGGPARPPTRRRGEAQAAVLERLGRPPLGLAVEQEPLDEIDQPRSTTSVLRS